MSHVQGIQADLMIRFAMAWVWSQLGKDVFYCLASDPWSGARVRPLPRADIVSRPVALLLELSA
jgi:hypothetical protein